MAALLNAATISAVETRIASLTVLSDEIRDLLNSLCVANPENRAHNAWRPLTASHSLVKQSIIQLEHTLLSNEDAY